MEPEPADESRAGHTAEVCAFLDRSNDLLRGAQNHVRVMRDFLAASRVERSREIVATTAARIEETRARIVAARDEAPDDARIANGFRKHVEEMRSLLARSGEARPAIEAEAGTEDPGTARDSDLRQALLATNQALERACAALSHGRRLLEREHAKYLDGFEPGGIPTLITDERAAVRDANRAAADALGVEQRSLMGRLLIGFVARQDVPSFREFARPLWADLGSQTRSVIVRIRPRREAVVRTKISVRFVRSVRRKNVGLRWTLEALAQQAELGAAGGASGNDHGDR